MKTMSFPVKPGDILEFKKNGEKLRGKVAFVTFSSDDAYATIYEEDIYTKFCHKCNSKNSKCPYKKNDFCEANKNGLFEWIDEIYANEIGKDKKYKIVSKSWEFEK